MKNKTSIKIDKKLNRQLSIFALLERREKSNQWTRKEVLMNEILANGLKKYQKKYDKYRFT